MKSIFWDILKPVELKGTVWEDLDDTKIKLNLDSLEDKFSQVQKKPKVEEAPKEVKKEKKTFIEGDRTRNINIVLNKIHYDPLEISDALEQYNIEVLTPDNCGLLEPIMPTESEIKEVAAFNGDVLTELASGDQFVLIVSGIIGYRERLKALIFRYCYQEEYDAVMKEMNRFFKVFKFLKEDKNLAKLFEIFLALGNYMNGGGFKGGAYGFTIDSIKNFADTKSKDNKSNFIDYIILMLHEQLKDNEMVEILLKKFKKFKKLQYQGIQESVKNLNSKFNDAKALKGILEKNKDQLLQEDQSDAFMKSFYDDAEKKVTEVQKKFEDIDAQYLGIAKFFGAKPDKLDIIGFVNIFRKFYDDFQNAESKYQEKLERKKKKKK